MATDLIDAGVRVRNALTTILVGMENQTGALQSFTDGIIGAAEVMLEFGNDADRLADFLTLVQLAGASTAAVGFTSFGGNSIKLEAATARDALWTDGIVIGVTTVTASPAVPVPESWDAGDMIRIDGSTRFSTAETGYPARCWTGWIFSWVENAAPILMASNPGEENPALYSFTRAEARDVALAVAALRGIDFIDNYSIFAGLGLDAFTNDEIHMNVLGHSIVTQNIVGALGQAVMTQ